MQDYVLMRRGAMGGGSVPRSVGCGHVALGSGRDKFLVNSAFAERKATLAFAPHLTGRLKPGLRPRKRLSGQCHKFSASARCSVTRTAAIMVWIRGHPGQSISLFPFFRAAAVPDASSWHKEHIR